MSPSPRRTSEQVSHQILTVADRLFYAQGLRATGINQIIAEAGVAKASFYAHFATKDALALAYLEHRHARWFEQLRAVTDAARTPRGRALGAFTFLGRWLPSVEFRGCAFLNLIGEGSISPALSRAVTEHKAQLRAFFHETASALSPSKGAARALGDHLLLLFEGAIIESQVHRDAWPIKAAARTAAELLTVTPTT